MDPHHESSWAISDDGVINDDLWSNGSCSSWGTDASSRSDGRLSSIAGVSWLKRLKGGFGVALLSVVLLPVENFTLMA